MDKEQALEEFFKSLRVAIAISAIYFKEHPVFINSVENLVSASLFAGVFGVRPLEAGVGGILLW